MRDATCRQWVQAGGPDFWFSELPRQQRRAKKMCARCPVWDGCLEMVAQDPEQYGVWAGMSLNDRRRMMDGRRWERIA